jgi:8-oxo-dGTP pyrophosphatase MutT (NUDIX family)
VSAEEEISAGGVVVHHTAADPSASQVLLIRDSYRNWGFPKGHVEVGESASDAALREVAEETGLRGLRLLAPLDTIDWYFRFRGRVVHKTCHFYLMECDDTTTSPQRDEGISACRWESLADAESLVSYENARGVLRRAAEVLKARGG